MEPSPRVRRRWVGGVVWLNVTWFVCRDCWCEEPAVGVGLAVIGMRVSAWRDVSLVSYGGVAEKIAVLLRTFVPAMTTLPSAAHAIVKPSPPSCTVAVHVLLRTSQNLQAPSLETEANSASFVGLNATLSICPVCPLSSVLFLTCGFSGFHMRRVRSAEPVAIRCPVGFHAMVLML